MWYRNSLVTKLTILSQVDMEATPDCDVTRPVRKHSG